jgi:SAM-dependent methyltransferase
MSLEYDKDSSFWNRDKKLIQSDFLVRPHIYKLIDNIREKVVADLGAGEGYVSKELINRGVKKVVAVEKSKSMIKEGYNQSNKIEWFEGDVSKLSMIESQSIDLAVSVMVYPHLNLKKMDLANAEVNRILREDGVFILAIPHPLMFVSLPKTRWYEIFSKNINYWENKAIKMSLFSGKNKEFGPFYAHAHSLSNTLNSLIKNGLRIVKSLEPKPTKKDLNTYKNMWGEEDRKPFYLLLKCIKK